MMKTIKIIFSALLLFSALLSLSACTDKKKDVVHSEGEILAAAEEKIKASVLWNRIFYIDGLPTLDGGRTMGNYKEVDPAYLEEIGMERVSDIVSYGETIFSSSMMQVFQQTLFSAIKDDAGGMSTSSVCFDYIEKADGVENFICVMVDPSESPRFFASEVVYLFDTMQVDDNLNGRATVSLSVRKSGESGDGALRTIRVNLLLENEVWLLDGYTFAVFQSEES